MRLTPLAPEIRVEPTIDATRYRLPRRRLGRVGRIAALVAFVAIGAVAVPLAALAFEIAAVLSGASAGGSLVVPGFVTVLFIAIGIPVCRLASIVAFGTAEVRVGRTALRCVDRAGPFRWSRSIPTAEIRELKMLSGPMPLRRHDRLDEPEDLGGIVALCGEVGTKRSVVIGYPGDLLVGLSEAIGRSIGVPTSVDTRATLRRHDPEASPEPELPAAVPQPPGSTAILTRSGAEVSIALPPRGVVRGSKGLLTFAVVWNLVVWAMVGAGAIVVSSLNQPGWAAVGGALFLSLFVLIGLWSCVEVVRMGRRKAIIDVVGDTLLLTISTPLRSSQVRWTRDEIAAVRVGPSGTSINDRPVLELQVFARRPDGTRRKHGFFGERDDDELRWIAGEVVAALDPEPPPAHYDAPHDP